MSGTAQSRYAAEEASEFNREHPVGTPVLFWPGLREGKGKLARTRSAAKVFAGHTAAVLIEGHIGVVALSHVEVIRG